jgi:hypothetical protein
VFPSGSDRLTVMGNRCLTQLQEHHRRDPHRAFNRVDHGMIDPAKMLADVDS